MGAPEKSQVDAALRHVYTAGGTTITLLSALMLLPADKVQPAIDALHQMGDDLKSFMGHAAVLWGIIGPAIMYIAGKGATVAASFPNQVKAIVAKAFSTTGQGAADAKTALVQAVDNMTVLDSDAAHADAAKIAIVTAASKLPEVDTPKLVAAIADPSLKAAAAVAPDTAPNVVGR